MLNNKINIPSLKNQLNYDPDSGIFNWKEKGSGRRANLVAGSLKDGRDGKNKWRRIVFEAQEYTSGQIAWALMKGEFPDFIVDHIDQNPLNDKWINLRRGDNFVSQRNQRKSSNNKTGITGVKWVANQGIYHAIIGIGGKQQYLGCSADFFEICCVRKKAEFQYNYSPLHGL